MSPDSHRRSGRVRVPLLVLLGCEALGCARRSACPPMSSASAPLDAAIVARVRASFARQGAMATFGAELADVATGRVAIALPIKPRLSQQDGFLHAGVVVAALDSACGYAALTMMPDEAEVLTIELKVNLLAPASGDRKSTRLNSSHITISYAVFCLKKKKKKKKKIKYKKKKKKKKKKKNKIKQQ